MEREIWEDSRASFYNRHQYTVPCVKRIHCDEELFKKRYEEGYNIYDDPNYVSWLTKNHPETVPALHESDDPPLREDLEVLVSLADLFPDASPCEPWLSR